MQEINEYISEKINSCRKVLAHPEIRDTLKQYTQGKLVAFLLIQDKLRKDKRRVP